MLNMKFAETWRLIVMGARPECNSSYAGQNGFCVLLHLVFFMGNCDLLFTHTFILAAVYMTQD